RPACSKARGKPESVPGEDEEEVGRMSHRRIDRAHHALGWLLAEKSGD
ncbi:MAG: hypothetical protein RL369_1587, partial [Pseudomonadota bacterium]